MIKVDKNKISMGDEKDTILLDLSYLISGMLEENKNFSQREILQAIAIGIDNTEDVSLSDLIDAYATLEKNKTE